MTVRELVNAIEGAPIEIPEGKTKDEALLDTEVRILVVSSSGTYTRLTNAQSIFVRDIPHDKKKRSAIVIRTGAVYDTH